MSYKEGQFHIKQSHHTPNPTPPRLPTATTTSRPTHPITPWQRFMYSFGNYSMSRATYSYRIPYDRQ